MSITLDQVTKRYQGAPVVNDVSLEVGDGEFFVLLGPSGSGKSTLLRVIAGLTGVDHGHVYLRGRDVTQVSARDRGVGMVFQNYALFRHMTIAANIEFALQVRGLKASERRRRRQELLRLVALEGMDGRLPTQLSGGQQQRVAVARALAHKPEVLLLDEPFGALDAKIRDELRRTIRSVQRELGITAILVTHDQQEAFELADRIAVMNLGHLLECGRPADLYARPATRFVAAFLGAANLLLVQPSRFGGQHHTSDDAAEAVAVVRPEEIEIAAESTELQASVLAEGVVEEIVFSGGLERLRVRLEHTASASAGLMVTEEAAVLDVTRTQPEQRDCPVIVGQSVAVGVRRVHFLTTPLSSFSACAPTQVQALALSQEPFLVELAQRMRTRIGLQFPVPPSTGEAGELHLGVPPGVAVVSGAGDVAVEVEELLRRGARQVLVLAPSMGAPQRVLIHWSDRAVRSRTLAVAASLLRHVEAEALYLSVLPDSANQSERSAGTRGLLDARQEAQGLYGLQIRTELASGDSAEQIMRALLRAPGQMLILGITGGEELHDRYGSLLQATRQSHLLIVRQAGEEGA